MDLSAVRRRKRDLVIAFPMRPHTNAAGYLHNVYERPWMEVPHLSHVGTRVPQLYGVYHMTQKQPNAKGEAQGVFTPPPIREDAETNAEIMDGLRDHIVASYKLLDEETWP